MKLKEIEYCKILALRDQKYSIRKISDIFGKPKSTVADAIKKFKERHSIDRKMGSGQPSLIHTEDKRAYMEILKSQPKISAPKLA